MSTTSTAVPDWRTAPPRRRPEHLGPEAPAAPVSKAPAKPQKPRCYAVGAGGAAHIKVLLGAAYGLYESADVLGMAGSSASALAMGGPAFGIARTDAEKTVVDMLQHNRVLDFSPLAWRRYGLCRWHSVRDAVIEMYGAKTQIGEADIPFAVVVCDLYTRKPVVFSSWATPKVLMCECLPASAAIPFLAEAKEIPSAGVGNRLHVDGGVAENFALDLFADKPEPTVGLCLSGQVDATPKRINGIVDYVQAIAELALWESADVSARTDDRVLALRTEGSGFNFNQKPEEIRAGIASGRQQVLDAIKAGLFKESP